MADPIDNKLVDKRVAHRYVRKGKLDEKDYDRHLKGLPDLADQAVPVQASLDDDDLDDLDDLDEELDETGEADPAAEAPAVKAEGAGEPEGGAGGGPAQP